MIKKIFGLLLISFFPGCGQPLSPFELSNPLSNEENFLVGDWALECARVTPDSTIDKNSRSGTATFKEKKVRTTVQEFTLPNCSNYSGDGKQKHKSTLTLESSYEFAGDSQSAIGATQINNTLDEIFITFHIDYIVEEMNQISLFGINNWQKDVAVKVTGRQEDPEDENSKTLPAKGEILYDIVQAKGQKLFFGLGLEVGQSDSNLGRSEDKRPTVLLENVYLQKIERGNSLK